MDVFITEFTMQLEKILKVVSILLIMTSVNNIVGQDSLYLVGTMTGDKAGDQFGVVAPAGDVNGDGYADILVSSRDGNYVRLYWGGAEFSTQNYTLIEGWKELQNFGLKVVGIGDINHDGYDEILVYSIDYSLSGLQKGHVFLYFGGEDFDTVPDLDFHENWIQDAFGASIGSAGDVNNDGYNDFLIASPYNWSDAIGRVYLFYGADTISSEPSVVFVSNTVEDFFGQQVTGIGDINNDGYDDIAIGTDFWMLNTDSLGNVKIYYGGAEMDSIPDVVLKQKSLNFGLNVKNALDLNCNGQNNLIVTSLEYVYFYEKLDYETSIYPSKWGIGGYNEVGVGGDINNDGYADYLIGNSNYVNQDDVMVGAAFGFWGGSKLDTVPDFFMEGGNKWGEFSWYMSIVGDINGDGYDEVLISEPQYPDYKNPVGRVYIYSYAKFDGIRNPEESNNVKGYLLEQNYPNPFNPDTRIKFTLPQKSHVTIEVYSVNGELTRRIVDLDYNAGYHYAKWNGKDQFGNQAASGIYFYRIKAGSFTDTKKMILIR